MLQLLRAKKNNASDKSYMQEASFSNKFTLVLILQINQLLNALSQL